MSRILSSGGGCAWHRGVCGGEGGMCGRGMCMTGGVHGSGVCMVGGVHGGRGMCGRGVCMAGCVW